MGIRRPHCFLLDKDDRIGTVTAQTGTFASSSAASGATSFRFGARWYFPMPRTTVHAHSDDLRQDAGLARRELEVAEAAAVRAEIDAACELNVAPGCEVLSDRQRVVVDVAASCHGGLVTRPKPDLRAQDMQRWNKKWRK